MRMTSRFLAVLAATLLLALPAYAQDKVVYHIDNAEAQATKGLRNARNHLDVAPDTKIVVVTHAEGIDFLMEGAKDKKNPDIDYASLVSAEFTPSGVARIGQLQSREKYAYIKP
jgi:hypothetical protein